LISLLEIFDQNITLSWLHQQNDSHIARNQKQGILSIYGLPSDQSQRQIGFSLEFLYGIEVPVHTGPEMLAKRYDLNVILQSKK
jgi:KDO2-lipid IV(A) lauroyltransferase